jgi:hypothetical protein
VSTGRTTTVLSAFVFVLPRDGAWRVARGLSAARLPMADRCRGRDLAVCGERNGFQASPNDQPLIDFLRRRTVPEARHRQVEGR